MLGRRVSSDLLKHCPWCGSRPEIRCDTQPCYGYGDSMRDLYDFYQIFCSNRYCHVRGNRYETFHTSEYDHKTIYGMANPKETAIIEWNAGNIDLNLHVILPDQYYVQSRTLLPSKYSHLKPAKLQIVIPKKRGIDAKFRENLSVVLNADGSINAYRFMLRERWAMHCQVRLLKIVEDFGYATYEFECQNTAIDLNQDNKTDSAWLKTLSNRPPINDKVFEILSKQIEIVEDVE